MFEILQILPPIIFITCSVIYVYFIAKSLERKKIIKLNFGIFYSTIPDYKKNSGKWERIVLIFWIAMWVFSLMKIFKLVYSQSDMLVYNISMLVFSTLIVLEYFVAKNGFSSVTPYSFYYGDETILINPNKPSLKFKYISFRWEDIDKVWISIIKRGSNSLNCIYINLKDGNKIPFEISLEYQNQLITVFKNKGFEIADYDEQD